MIGNSVKTVLQSMHLMIALKLQTHISSIMTDPKLFSLFSDHFWQFQSGKEQFPDLEIRKRKKERDIIKIQAESFLRRLLELKYEKQMFKI